MTPAPSIAVHEIEVPTEADVAALAEVLVATVHDGASVGFLPPLDQTEAEAYWRGALAPGVHLFAAEVGGRLVGTVQLQLALKANASHRAEIAKLLVHPDARRKGVGRALMEHAEAAAREHGRTLLVLDTRAGDVSNHLYRSLGYVEAGRIPRYARSAGGELDETIFFYKELG